jgi:hypothetical protein
MIRTWLHWEINRVRPRLLELGTATIVIYSQTRECRVSGERAMAWKVKRV